MTDNAKRIADILKSYTNKNKIMASHVILDEYAEELERNGLFMPICKVGDKVYAVSDVEHSCNNRIESKAEELTVTEVATRRIFCSAYLNGGDDIDFEITLDMIGESIFLSKEQAEKACVERNRQ